MKYRESNNFATFTALSYRGCNFFVRLNDAMTMKLAEFFPFLIHAPKLFFKLSMDSLCILKGLRNKMLKE